jgi:membrane-bound lytic murein transglycosylase A
LIGRAGHVLAPLLLLTMTAAAPSPGPAIPSVGPGGAVLSPVSFDAIPGWSGDDHAATMAAFLRSCEAIADGIAALRPGVAPPAILASACRDALAARPATQAGARSFFEERFRAWRITPRDGEGFLTGYYEPEVEASEVRTGQFPVPVLGRPADLVTLAQGETAPGLDPALAAARRTPGGLEPYPDRAAIEDGALDGRGLERLWLRDRVELFFLQVQGSARAVLPDGRVVRLVYAGRNGQPYTSIGKVIVSEGLMRLEDMTLRSLKAWLRANPQEARRILRMNRSYVFFSVRDDLDPAEGPIGAASVPLTPLRSIAVDRTLWPYGLPFFISADLPDGTGKTGPFARLTIAQDTGSAILGPARADLFTGWGQAAGDHAGDIRHRGDLVVLLPLGITPGDLVP